MELSGEEKRIQRLFRELKLEDEGAMPPFTRSWARAQARELRPKARFVFRTIVVTFGLIGAMVLGVALIMRERKQPGPVNNALNNSEPLPALKVADSGPGPSLRQEIPLKKRLLVRRRFQQSTAPSIASLDQRPADRTIEISSWQSPTNALLKSPGERLLKSLPQMDQSARDLKSFLPDRLN